MSSKRYLYRAACLAALIVCLSCGTGDDDGSRLGELIAGTWQRTDLAIEGDTDLDPEDLTYDKFIFNGDGTYNGMVRQGSFTTLSRYGNVIIEGTYKCDNDNLRLEFDDEGTTRKILAQVLSYTETTLRLQYKLEDYDITVRLLLHRMEADDQSSSVTSDD